MGRRRNPTSTAGAAGGAPFGAHTPRFRGEDLVPFVPSAYVPRPAAGWTPDALWEAAWAYAEGNYQGARGAAVAAQEVASRAMSASGYEDYVLAELAGGLAYSDGPPPWSLYSTADDARRAL